MICIHFIESNVIVLCLAKVSFQFACQLYIVTVNEFINNHQSPAMFMLCVLFTYNEMFDDYLTTLLYSFNHNLIS